MPEGETYSKIESREVWNKKVFMHLFWVGGVPSFFLSGVCHLILVIYGWGFFNSRIKYTGCQMIKVQVFQGLLQHIVYVKKLLLNAGCQMPVKHCNCNFSQTEAQTAICCFSPTISFMTFVLMLFFFSCVIYQSRSSYLPTLFLSSRSFSFLSIPFYCVKFRT